LKRREEGWEVVERGKMGDELLSVVRKRLVEVDERKKEVQVFVLEGGTKELGLKDSLEVWVLRELGLRHLQILRRKKKPSRFLKRLNLVCCRRVRLVMVLLKRKLGSWRRIEGEFALEERSEGVREELEVSNKSREGKGKGKEEVLILVLLVT